ncbi:MAG: MqnA/MqnD/SBP family protein, partial [Planctomycetota bacterium]
MTARQSKSNFTSSDSDRHPPFRRQHVRLGALPYMVARPLIDDLDHSPQFDVVRAGAGEIGHLLATGVVHAGLVSPVDLQRLGEHFTMLPVGCIASTGPTVLLRMFSRAPMDQIRTVWADEESRIAASLAQVLWAMRYKRPLHVIPATGGLDGIPSDAEAAVVVGDRVVISPPLGFDYQFDLVAMWHRMTGLPFVFAVWAASNGTDLAALSASLDRARCRGQAGLAEIAARYGFAHRWPLDLAHRELTKNLTYEMGD